MSNLIKNMSSVCKVGLCGSGHISFDGKV